MPRMLAILVILTISFNYGQSIKCPSCRDSDCNQPEVPLLECNRHIAQVPYGQLKRDAENANFACLALEYEIGTKTTFVRQCHVVTAGNDLCADIESTLPSEVTLKTCDFEISQNFDLIDVARENEEEGDKSSTPISSTPVSSTPDSSTPDSSTPVSSTHDSSSTIEISTDTPTPTPEDTTTEEGTTAKPGSSNVAMLSTTVLIIAFVIQKVL